MGSELEIEWDPDSGARLEKSINSIGGGQEWMTVQGSTETNLVRVVMGDRPEFFRLAGQTSE
jgi:hypothetical protein